jgi:hypothetical protein
MDLDELVELIDRESARRPEASPEDVAAAVVEAVGPERFAELRAAALDTLEIACVR